MKCLLVFVGALAVASAIQVPLYSYPGYTYPSLYSTGLTYTQPIAYSSPLVYNFQPKIEDVETVFDLTAKFINKLKDTPAAEPTVRTKRSPQVPITYYTNAVPLTAALASTGTTPVNPKIEDIEKVFGLMGKFIAELKANIPAGAIPATTIPAGAIPTYPGAVPVAYQAKEVKIEQVEAVFDSMAKFIGELKANIPANAIPTGAIPAYPGAIPVNYQPSDVKVEEIEAVFGLLKKFTAQLLTNNPAVPAATTPAAPAEAAPAEAAPAEVAPAEAAPAEATPSTYDLANGCKNSLGDNVPCALRRKRSPQVVAPIAYNTAPLTYVAQPLTYTYPIATPVTYKAVEIDNKPKIEDVEKVFDLTADFIKTLKANIPADAGSIPPVSISPVVISPVVIPPVSIPAVNIPAVNIPAVTIPAQTVPAQTVPAGAISFL